MIGTVEEVAGDGHSSPRYFLRSSSLILYSHPDRPGIRVAGISPDAIRRQIVRLQTPRILAACVTASFWGIILDHPIALPSRLRCRDRSGPGPGLCWGPVPCGVLGVPGPEQYLSVPVLAGS